MLRYQLFAGILLGSMSALIFWKFDFSILFMVFAYSFGGALGFVATGLFVNRGKDVNVAQDEDGIGSEQETETAASTKH